MKTLTTFTPRGDHDIRIIGARWVDTDGNRFPPMSENTFEWDLSIGWWQRPDFEVTTNLYGCPHLVCLSKEVADLLSTTEWQTWCDWTYVPSLMYYVSPQTNPGLVLHWILDLFWKDASDVNRSAEDVLRLCWAITGNTSGPRLEAVFNRMISVSDPAAAAALERIKIVMLGR